MGNCVPSEQPAHRSACRNSIQTNQMLKMRSLFTPHSSMLSPECLKTSRRWLSSSQPY
jgi:hypothetical protein